MTEPLTTQLTFNLKQLRILAKSISRSLDAEAKKLERLRPGTPVHTDVSADYNTLDTIDAEVRDAMREIVARGMS